MDILANKRAVREEMQARLHALPPATRALEEELVTAGLQDMLAWRQAATLLLYRSVPPEFSTVGLANAAWRAGKRVLFPRIRPDNTLTLHAVTGWQEFEVGPLGIPQPMAACPQVDPSEVDLALIPGLAWDRGGGRLGRGGGHYDRLVPQLRRTWGIGFDLQLVAAVPHEAHDCDVSKVWTPSLLPR